MKVKKSDRKPTIKDVAAVAQVSIATVSHVINRTRYVKPELTEKVNRAIVETGYIHKVEHRLSNLRTEKSHTVAVIVSDMSDVFYAKFTRLLSNHLSQQGYLVSFFLSEGDVTRETAIYQLIQQQNKDICGLIIVPSKEKNALYQKMAEATFPVIGILHRLNYEGIENIMLDYKMAATLATGHFLTRGHSNIMILVDSREPEDIFEARISGYREALHASGMKSDEANIVRLDISTQSSLVNKQLSSHLKKQMPTAVYAAGNRLTVTLLETLQRMGMEWPKDISVIGMNDDERLPLQGITLTTIRYNYDSMAKKAAELISQGINRDHTKEFLKDIIIPAALKEGNSVQMIGKGPFGELAISPDKITFTKTERERLKNAGFRVGISFHYGNTAWERLHERGIRETLSDLGISVTSVQDANFDPTLQILQLEGLLMQNIDAVIAIPVNDEITAKTFKKVSRQSKLVFMSNVPQGMHRSEYATCVSVNERGNGYNAGMLIGNYFEGRKANIGIISHGAPFYGTQLRDTVARDTIREFPNLTIVSEKHFYRIDNAYKACREMIEEHPEIEGLYISWDEPSLHAIRALKEMKRTDVKIVTTDLDYEIATYLAREEMVVGISTQRPFEQGVAVANATAKALLAEEEFKYVAVTPYLVTYDNLIRAWKEIFHEKAPAELIEIIIENLRK